MAAIINSPYNDTHAIYSDDMENPNFSIMQSFVAPAEPDLIKPSRVKKRAAKTTRTPHRQIFGDRTNRPKGEFTPLLKSIHKGSMQDKINAAVARTPSFMKYGRDVSMLAELPRGDSSGVEGSSYNDENTPLAAPQDMNSSDASTPLPMVRGKGVLDDGQLTLREQEKIIDDIKKENFGLKLKIFFLDDRLNKLGPEYNDIAIKENVELKVEHATLRSDLKKYKKALQEAEKAVTELRQDTLGMQQKAKQRYADSKQMEKDAQALQEVQDLLAQKEDELESLSEKYDHLKLEMADRDKTEDEDATEIARLSQRIKDLEEEKGDLEAELRSKDTELDERNESEDKENEELRRRIKELEEELQRVGDAEEERDEELVNENERLKAELEELHEEGNQLESAVNAKENEKLVLIEEHEEHIQDLNSKMMEAKQRLQTLHQEKQLLQTQVTTFEKERAGKDNELGNRVVELQAVNDELSYQCKSLEAELQRTQSERKGLDESITAMKDLHKEQMDELRENIRERSITMKSRVQERDENRQRLQRELDQLQNDLLGMTNLHKERSHEVERLKIRVNELTNNSHGDAKNMQKEITALREESDRAIRLQREVESQKDLLQQRHNALTTESQQLQTELQKLRKELEGLNETLLEERHAASLNEQALKTQFDLDKERLTENVEELQIYKDELSRLHDRNSENWKSEKRQLETKLAREETKVQNLEATIANLRNSEGSAHGKELQLITELENQKQQHAQEVEHLNLQISNLTDEIERRKLSFEKQVLDLQHAKEELRQVRKSEKAFEEKLHSLEDDLDYATQQNEEETRSARDNIKALEDKCEKLQLDLKESKESLAIVQSQLRREQSNLRVYQDDMKSDTSSQQQLQDSLAEVERRLGSVQKDKQQLQEQLSKSNSQINTLKNLSSDVEMERNELHSQVLELREQVGSSLKLDQEKLELRKVKGRLEIELKQMTNERDILNEKAEELELQLEESCNQAVIEEKRLESEILSLKTKITALNTTRDKEGAQAKRDISRLKATVQELSEQLQQRPDYEDDIAELTNVKNDLELARQREQDLLQREATTKDRVRELRERVSRLETELHDARLARPRSPNDTQAQIERSELHQHLMNARLQIEELQIAQFCLLGWSTEFVLDAWF